MNYQETLHYLFNSLPFFQNKGKAAYKADLDRSLALDAFFKHPHKSYPTIHIAGTNGKGSVSHILSSVLQEAGLKTGLYTSPHLRDFRERIKVNGTMASEDFVVDFVSKYKKLFEEIHPSFFEMTVAMAFEYFRLQEVDIAVIETGLGGRLDSTNIITPIASIITNISLDHTDLLGDNIIDIAIEKAGIIKKNIPVIIGESDTETDVVFTEFAKRENTKIYFADKELNFRRSNLQKTNKGSLYQEITYEKNKNEITIATDLCGNYQQKNIATALIALETIKTNYTYNINEEHIAKGLSNSIGNTKFEGRWQQISSKPAIICDTAHNYAGIKQISKQLLNTDYKHLHLILGMVSDKDFSSILQLLPESDNISYYYTQASIERALPKEKLAQTAKKLGKEGRICQNVSAAIKIALTMSGENDLIYIGGSTFIVADALLHFDNAF